MANIPMGERKKKCTKLQKIHKFTQKKPRIDNFVACWWCFGVSKGCAIGICIKKANKNM
jgi:hypothetical protein